MYTHLCSRINADAYYARVQIAPIHAYSRLNTTYALHAHKWTYADRECAHDDWFCGLRQRGYGGTDIYPEIHADKHICTCTHIRVIASPNIYVHSFCVCRQGDTSHIHKHRQMHAHGRTTTYAQRNISRVMYASCFFFRYVKCNHTVVCCMSVSTTPCV